MIQTNVITPLRQRLQNCGSSLSASDFKALLDALELLEKNILDQGIASIGDLRAQVEGLSAGLDQVSYSVEDLRLKVEDLSNILNQVIASVGGLSFILDQVIVSVEDLSLKVEGLILKVEDLSIDVRFKVDNAFIAQEEETYYLVLTSNGEELTRVQLPAVTRKG